MSRRCLIAGGMAFTLVAGGCRREDDDPSLVASAARGGERRFFQDAVGWTEFDGLSAVLVFVPFQMSDDQRRLVLESRAVYPTLPSSEPILEVRLEIKPGHKKDDLRITAGNLRSVQLTFWYFDEPAPVIRIAQEDWQSSGDIELVGLDGEMRRGGWVVGTIRGKQVYKNPRDVDEAYLWNVKFVQSLV